MIMNTFMLTIASPDGNKYSDQAQMLTARGVDGDLAILAGHIPFITALKPCDCKVVLPDETEKLGTVDGGLLTVSEKGVTLLSGSFEWK